MTHLLYLLLLYFRLCDYFTFYYSVFINFRYNNWKQKEDCPKTFFFFLPINFLYLGLPSFSGFTPKWIIIQLLSSKIIIFSLLILLFFFLSLITLYFYLRLFVPIMPLSFPSFTISLKIKPLLTFSPILIFVTFINMFGICFPIPFLA